MGRRGLQTLLAGLLLAVALPSSASAATCSDYPNQAAAQRAADTRDSDGDGIYCESLPCPCLKPGSPPPPPPPPRRPSCSKPRNVVNLVFGKTRYPNIRAHFLFALSKGWPRTLVVNRPGATARRNRLLRGIPTRPGFDRDEYPPGVSCRVTSLRRRSTSPATPGTPRASHPASPAMRS